jgi:hypothetical protein
MRCPECYSDNTGTGHSHARTGAKIGTAAGVAGASQGGLIGLGFAGPVGGAFGAVIGGIVGAAKGHSIGSFADKIAGNMYCFDCGHEFKR